MKKVKPKNGIFINLICKVCKKPLDIERDLPNIKLGDHTCLRCWYKEEHDYDCWFD